MGGEAGADVRIYSCSQMFEQSSTSLGAEMKS
jgi:hypothetical protein